jgi:diadenosine tetraphosphatase ApaH/serine/threonine PP2A family protein phosphatase
MEACDARILVVGDAHVQGLYAWDDELVGEARRLAFEMGVRRPLEPGRRSVVCPGAVGYGRDGASSPRYAVIEGDFGSVQYREVEGPVVE